MPHSEAQVTSDDPRIGGKLATRCFARRKRRLVARYPQSDRLGGESGRYRQTGSLGQGGSCVRAVWVDCRLTTS